MPNPTCTINGSPTPVDVSASASVTGALAVPAGARFWSVVCVSTDETTTVAAINATLTVNQGAKTFQFTSGAAGSAAIFKSTVGVLGLGLDANGTVQPNYTTTFKVNVKTTGGFRVIAEGETFEQNAVAGWIVEVNDFIRNGGGGGGGGFTAGGDLGGSSSSQTVLALTGTTGTVAIHASTLTFDQSVTSPTWSQAQQANASAPHSSHVAPQPPGASATNATNGTPGSFFLDFAQPVNSGSEAIFQATRAVSGTPTPIWSLETTSGGAGLLRLSNLAGSSFDSTISNGGPAMAFLSPSSGYAFSMTGVGGNLVQFTPSDGIRILSPLKGLAIGGSADYSNGSGVLAMQNAGTAPTSAPAGGFILYGDSGNVAYRTSSNFQMDLPTGTATTATAGGTGALPVTVLGYLVATIGGTTIKIPYYAN